MYLKRRFARVLVLLVSCYVMGAAANADQGAISSQDWAKKGNSASDAPAASPEPQQSTPTAAKTKDNIPAEALLPAVEPPKAEMSPEPSPEPQAVLAKPKAAEDGAARTVPSPEPSAGGTERVKGVNEWVAKSSDEPAAPGPEKAPEATNGNGVAIPPSGQMSAGQVKTGAGTIDLNSINLDKLYEELKKASPKREDAPMSLQSAVQQALERNPDIKVTSYEPLKADADILTAKGEFDPTLNGKFTKSNSSTKASSQISSFTGGLGSGSSSLLGGGNSNILGNVLRSISRTSLLGNNNNSNNSGLGRLVLMGALSLLSSAGNTVRNFVNPSDDQEYIIEQDNTVYETTLQGKIPWGTQYQVKLNVTDESSTYSGNVDEYSGGLTLSLSQPLLRGRGPKANLARIRIAKNSREIAENQLMTQVMQTVADTVKAYWDLVGAEQQLSVREKSLENAERLLDVNQRRLNIGIGAALDVVQAKASVAQRTSDVIASRNQVIAAEDRLKLLLDLKDNEEYSHKHIVATDTPEAKELDLDEQASIARALENRPELKSSDLEIDSAELDRYRAANNMQMKLDVSGSVFQGARGDKAGVVFDGIANRDDNSYQVQVEGEIPITNRVARGQYEKARQTKRQAEERQYKTKNQVEMSVRNAVRQAAASRIIVESSSQARALQETNVAAEEKRLKLGIATSFEALRTQEDLATANAQEVQAKIDYEKALADLKLAEGTILAALNVEYAMPEPEKPIGFVRSIVPPAAKDK